MAYWVIPLLILSPLIVKAENDCVVYDFENDFDSLFSSDGAICSGMGMELWSYGNYSEIGLEGPNFNSESFISSAAALSCISSFTFTMAGGGLIEIKAYIDSTSSFDQITVLVNQVVANGNDAVVGSAFISSSDASFSNGWQTIRITLVGTGNYEGYISFLGSSSGDSLVLIDSFRYMTDPSNTDSCVVYKDELSPTTEKQDVTEVDNEKEDCVTYNFESDFDIRFTTDNYLCDGFLPWHLDNYTSVDISSPDPSSTVFMTPNEVSSCISSFVFHMSPGGMIEANIYMEPVTVLDHIIVLAQKVTDKEYDTVAGFKMYYPENHVFVNGWNVIRFSLLDSTSFEGYLIFLGSAEKGSTVLVDSVRYIPPETPPSDSSCILY